MVILLVVRGCDWHDADVVHGEQSFEFEDCFVGYWVISKWKAVTQDMRSAVIAYLVEFACCCWNLCGEGRTWFLCVASRHVGLLPKSSWMELVRLHYKWKAMWKAMQPSWIVCVRNEVTFSSQGCLSAGVVRRTMWRLWKQCEHIFFEFLNCCNVFVECIK